MSTQPEWKIFLVMLFFLVGVGYSLWVAVKLLKLFGTLLKEALVGLLDSRATDELHVLRAQQEESKETVQKLTDKIEILEEENYRLREGYRVSARRPGPKSNLPS